MKFKILEELAKAQMEEASGVQPKSLAEVMKSVRRKIDEKRIDDKRSPKSGMKLYKKLIS